MRGADGNACCIASFGKLALFIIFDSPPCTCVFSFSSNKHGRSFSRTEFEGPAYKPSVKKKKNIPDTCEKRMSSSRLPILKYGLVLAISYRAEGTSIRNLLAVGL